MKISQFKETEFTMTFENKVELRAHARWLGPLLAIALGALTVASGFAQETEKKEQVTTTLHRDSVKAQAETDANKFKTREGRLKAKPLDWNATIGKPTPRAKVSHEEEELAKKREPRSAKGGPRNPNAKREAQKLHPEDWKRIGKPVPGHTMGLLREDIDGKLVLTAGSPDVFTQYCESCPSVNPDAPSAAIGRLFSNEGSCTASVISGNNVIVTAAHCCYDRTKKNWIGGWSFVPAYDNGNAPFGTFDWSAATVRTSWIDNGDIPSDVCLINLQNDSAGHGVAYYTGWLGRAWDWGSDQELHALGVSREPGKRTDAGAVHVRNFQSGQFVRRRRRAEHGLLDDLRVEWRALGHELPGRGLGGRDSAWLRQSKLYGDFREDVQRATIHVWQHCGAVQRCWMLVLLGVGGLASPPWPSTLRN